MFTVLTVLFIVLCVYVVIGGFIIHIVMGYGPMEVSKLKLWKVTIVGGFFMSLLWLISYASYWFKRTIPFASWLKD